MGLVLSGLFLGAVLAQGRVDAGFPVVQEPVEEDQKRIVLGVEYQELQQIVEVCAWALQRTILWEKGQIEGEVRVQPGLALNTEELWQLTVNSLALRGLAIVQAPGTDALRVVELERASTLARLEDRGLEGANAGYVKVLVPLRELDAERAKGVVTLVLSGKGSKVEAVTGANALLVADFAPQVGQAVALLERLDRATVPPLIVEVSLQRADPTALAALVGQIRAKGVEVSGERSEGELLPLASDRSLLVIAPAEEVAELRALIERFDREQPLVTEHYSPTRFGLAETAALVEEVVHGTDDVLAKEDWRLVSDELTGTLIVTTTPAKQRDVGALLARLEATGPDARRPMRTYPIRYRQVQEVLELLNGLLEGGAIELEKAESMQGAPAQGPTAALVSSRPRIGRSGEEITLTADEGTNRLIAIGEARLLDQLGPLIESLDVQESQVEVEAMALQLTETQLRDLGIELQRIGFENGVEYGLASLFGLGSQHPSSPPLPAAAGTGLTAAVLDPGKFSAVLRAVEDVTGGRTLTMPRMLVNNNETATLGSVLESPYTSTNASNTVATTSFGGSSEAGTTIQIKPQVAAGDSLVIDYDISLSGFVGEAADPALPPPKQSTSLKSVVTVPDGYAVIVGGIEQETETEGESRVPILGELPLVGRLFSSSKTNRTKSRFFVFLRCNVMRSHGFEELKYLSHEALDEAGLDDGWPKLEPRVIR